MGPSASKLGNMSDREISLHRNTGKVKASFKAFLASTPNLDELEIDRPKDLPRRVDLDDHENPKIQQSPEQVD